MPGYPEYDDQISQYLIDALYGESSDSPVMRNEGGLTDLVADLVNAIPYFTSPDFRIAHETALATQFAIKLPNNTISHEPSDSGYGFSARFEYIGNYSGYQDAFYHGVQSTPVQSKLNSEVSRADGSLNDAWWGKYSVALLTEGIRKVVSVQINTSSLTNALHTFHEQFRTGLSPSYLAVFTDGYAPTANAFKAIRDTGQMAEAAQMLNVAISDPIFMTNFNYVMMAGGNSVPAGEWFEFNLWIALKALGLPDVDGAIQAHKDEGLVVPAQLGPIDWWKGAYHDWFVELTDAILLDPCWSRMTEDLPQECYFTSFSPPPGGTSHAHSPKDNGYSISLCEWGSLSYYDYD